MELYPNTQQCSRTGIASVATRGGLPGIASACSWFGMLAKVGEVEIQTNCASILPYSLALRDEDPTKMSYDPV